MIVYRLMDRTREVLGGCDIQVTQEGRHVNWRRFKTRAVALAWWESRHADLVDILVEWDGSEWAEVAAMRER